MKLQETLKEVGFEKARRAVAALGLSLFVSLYLMLSLNAPEGWGPAFLGLALCYLVAFLAITAEWFWGRWFAAGLGWSGLMVSAMSIAMLGWMWPLAIYGALHGLIVLLLLGTRMIALYDLQEAWRQRYGMDEFGVARLRKTVTRSAASLPSMILWALGPKDPGQGMLHGGYSWMTVALGISGLVAVLRLRAWGVLALAAAAAALLVHGSLHGIPEVGMIGAGDDLPTLFGLFLQPVWGVYPGIVALVTLFGTLLPGALLVAALSPLVSPTLSFLRRTR